MSWEDILKMNLGNVELRPALNMDAENPDLVLVKHRDGMMVAKVATKEELKTAFMSFYQRSPSETAKYFLENIDQLRQRNPMYKFLDNFYGGEVRENSNNPTPTNSLKQNAKMAFEEIARQ
jgi:hypothetical protein